MTTIVCNLATAAVTEYDWAFASLSATRAASSDGLFELGGDDDDGAEIDAQYLTGITARDGTLKDGVESAYLSLTGAAGARGFFIVASPSETWSYEFEVLEAGVSRAKAGRGIRENLLGFGYGNRDGSDFSIERMEVRTTPSQKRRI
jgi:hypothetical protein